MERDGEGLGASTGSRASTEPVSRLGPSGFDPERAKALAKELAELSAHLKRCWDDVAKSEADSWPGVWGIEERLGAVAFVGKETARVVIQSLDKIASAIAMEARQGRDGETRLDGEAATARASSEASPTPSQSGE